MTQAESFVSYGIDIEAFKFSLEGWELNSGRLSHHFFNSAAFCNGKSFSRLVQAYIHVLDNFLRTDPTERVQVLFGPPYKGIFLVSGISLALTDLSHNIGFSCYRKEKKTHGERDEIIGSCIEGKNVVIIDDAITSRKTAEESIKKVVEAKGRVLAHVVAFDREEVSDCGDNLLASESIEQKFGVPVLSIAKVSDLISVLQQESSSERSREFLPKILAYQQVYGKKQK